MTSCVQASTRRDDNDDVCIHLREYSHPDFVSFEWTVRGLKHLFESSKGGEKSKVTKSIKFGGGRWQCLFYPNSGTDGGTYVSLYLSCEVKLFASALNPSHDHKPTTQPTFEEKENAVSGKYAVSIVILEFCQFKHCHTDGFDYVTIVF